MSPKDSQLIPEGQAELAAIINPDTTADAVVAQADLHPGTAEAGAAPKDASEDQPRHDDTAASEMQGAAEAATDAGDSADPQPVVTPDSACDASMIASARAPDAQGGAIRAALAGFDENELVSALSTKMEPERLEPDDDQDEGEGEPELELDEDSADSDEDGCEPNPDNDDDDFYDGPGSEQAPDGPVVDAAFTAGAVVPEPEPLVHVLAPGAPADLVAPADHDGAGTPPADIAGEQDNAAVVGDDVPAVEPEQGMDAGLHAGSDAGGDAVAPDTKVDDVDLCASTAAPAPTRGPATLSPLIMPRGAALGVALHVPVGDGASATPPVTADPAAEPEGTELGEPDQASVRWQRPFDDYPGDEAPEFDRRDNDDTDRREHAPLHAENPPPTDPAADVDPVDPPRTARASARNGYRSLETGLTDDEQEKLDAAKAQKGEGATGKGADGGASAGNGGGSGGGGSTVEPPPGPAAKKPRETFPRAVKNPENRDSGAVTVEIVDALKGRFPDQFFVQIGDMVHVRKNEAHVLTAAALSPFVTMAVTIVHTSEKREDRHSRPEAAFRVDITEGARAFFPTLSHIVYAPYLGPNGTIIETPGYCAATQLYLAWDGGPLGLDDITFDEAKDIVAGLLTFPFATPADRLHALGFYLLLLVRPAIEGPTPLHLIQAGMEGAGKSYLCECVGQLGLGREPAVRGFDEWKSEASRQLATYLLAAPSFLFLDNLPTDQRIGWPDLHRYVAANGPIALRPIGLGREVQVAIRAVLSATVNDADVDGEFSRRAVPIRLVGGGGGRAVMPPMALIRADRRKYIRALLRLVLEWKNRGCRKPARTLDGFNQWSDIVGGIASLGLDSTDWLHPDHRPQPQIWRDWAMLFETWPDDNDDLVPAWKELPAGVLADRVVELALPALGEAVGGDTNRASATKMGRLLKNLAASGRAHGGFRLREKKGRNGKLYFPERVEKR